MENSYYGAPEQTDIRPLRDRLRDYYAEADFVTVVNCDDKPLTYQFMAPDAQEVIQPSAYEREIHNRKPPVRITLQPAETKLCPAYEADLMIENLIKQITTSKMMSRISSGELADRAATSDWTDPEVQTRIIKEAFLGKEDLLGRYNQETTSGSEEPAKVGRPRKEV